MKQPLPSDLEPHIIRQAVEVRLEQVFNDGAARAHDYDGRYGRLWDAMRDVSINGGKRIRPYLTVVAYAGYGGTNEAIYQAATAQELLHISLLYHDDIMDHDYIRRGRPNVAGTYLEHYAGLPDARHLADSAALLAGDLLLASAYEQLAVSGFDPDLRQRAIAIFGKGVHEVAGGQLLDMEGAGFGGDPAESLTVARLKTASYSFVSPLVMGGALAGAPTGELADLEELGIALGIGFQLADDLLGLYGNEADTGKSVLSDVREGKATYLMRAAFVKCNPAEREWLNSTLGRSDITAADIDRTRSIVTNSGARADTEALLATQADKATAALGRLKITKVAQKALAASISQALWRKA